MIKILSNFKSKHMLLSLGYEAKVQPWKFKQALADLCPGNMCAVWGSASLAPNTLFAAETLLVCKHKQAVSEEAPAAPTGPP